MTVAPPVPRVIALGQPLAGDDAAGVCVLRALEERLSLPGVVPVELLELKDASELVECACHPGPVWLLDAVVDAGPPGQLLELTPEELEQHGSVSSHGLCPLQALALSQTLYPGALSPSIRILAISIAAPRRYRAGLSPPVAAAVQRAATLLLERL
jgi:hydrogenase maturation protease